MTRANKSDKAMIENLHFVKDLGQQSQAALESDNLVEFARLMDVHWQRKKERSQEHEQSRRLTSGTIARWRMERSAEN